MITILSTGIVPIYTIDKGFEWSRQSDGGVFNEGFDGRMWSHFFRRKYIWGPVGGFYPVLICDVVTNSWLEQNRWVRHPFEFNGRLWWHGACEPIECFREEFFDKVQRWTFTLFNYCYDKLNGSPSARAR